MASNRCKSCAFLRTVHWQYEGEKWETYYCGFSAKNNEGNDISPSKIACGDYEKEMED